MKSIIFWDMTPCSLLSFLPPAYLLVLAETIYLTLKMEAICSSETSVATQQTTRRHIPEDDTLQVRKYTHGVTITARFLLSVELTQNRKSCGNLCFVFL
jgi:hypothetical protein